MEREILSEYKRNKFDQLITVNLYRDTFSAMVSHNSKPFSFRSTDLGRSEEIIVDQTTIDILKGAENGIKKELNSVGVSKEEVDFLLKSYED